jgi:hypothetical protein
MQWLQIFVECAGHAKDDALSRSSSLPFRSSEQFRGISTSQKGAIIVCPQLLNPIFCFVLSRTPCSPNSHKIQHSLLWATFWLHATGISTVSSPSYLTMCSHSVAQSAFSGNARPVQELQAHAHAAGGNVMMVACCTIKQVLFVVADAHIAALSRK